MEQFILRGRWLVEEVAKFPRRMLRKMILIVSRLPVLNAYAHADAEADAAFACNCLKWSRAVSTVIDMVYEILERCLLSSVLCFCFLSPYFILALKF